MNEQCRTGMHPFIELLRRQDANDVVSVANWCPLCGAAVVDEEYQGRTKPGTLMKVRTPEPPNGS